MKVIFSNEFRLIPSVERGGMFIVERERERERERELIRRLRIPSDKKNVTKTIPSVKHLTGGIPFYTFIYMGRHRAGDFSVSPPSYGRGPRRVGIRISLAERTNAHGSRDASERLSSETQPDVISHDIGNRRRRPSITLAHINEQIKYFFYE